MHALSLILLLSLASSPLCAGTRDTATPVDINTASEAVLTASLIGVGPAKARAIIAWRNAHGGFKRLEDLDAVKGIGPAFIQRNRAYLRLDSAR